MEKTSIKVDCDLVIIAGVTGVGKTKLSIELAKIIQAAEVINVDALQLYKVALAYKAADIMTATATKEEMQGVPHHLLGVLELWDTDFNVQQFKDIFWKTVREIRSRGNLPIAVGGTNYYLEAILEQFLPQKTHVSVAIDDALKQRIEKSLETLEYHEMLACLQLADPEAARLTIKNDSRRVENSLKRLIAAPLHVPGVDGETPDDHGPQQKASESDLMVRIVYLDSTADDWLSARLLKRLKSMLFEEGGLAEVVDVLFGLAFYDLGTSFAGNDAVDLHTGFKNVLTKRQSQGVLQAIGYQEFVAFVFELANQQSASNLQQLYLACKESLKEIDKKSSLTQSLERSVEVLHSDTVRLVKKQRKYFKNRLLTEAAIKSRCLSLDVTSVEGFPFIIEAAASFVVTGDTKADRFAGLEFKKNPKTFYHCDLCSKDIVGGIEKTVHLKSKGHQAAAKRARRLAQMNTD